MPNDSGCRIRLFLLCVLFVSGASLRGQVASLAHAQALAGEGRWREAASEYAKLVHDDPALGAAWFGLGEAEETLGEWANSSQAFQRALDTRYQPMRALLHLARIAMAMNDAPSAVSWLERAASLGANKPFLDSVKRERAFDSLRDLADYEAVIERLTPCASPEYRRFDFWLGDWNVRDREGRPLGRSRVELAEDGCVVTETWTGTGGETGRSVSYYEPRTGRWNQLWLDNSGRVTSLSGNPEERSMVMISEGGTSPMTRGSWSALPGGAVRQLLEQSTDGGGRWVTAFEGIYTRRGAVAE